MLKCVMAECRTYLYDTLYLTFIYFQHQPPDIPSPTFTIKQIYYSITSSLNEDLHPQSCLFHRRKPFYIQVLPNEVEVIL